jgi:hypothetical protein
MSKPDIIVSGTLAGVIAAKKLTNTIPIVCADQLCPARRQCSWRVADCGGPANQTAGACSRSDEFQCLLLEVKQTLLQLTSMSAFNP